MPGCPPPDVRTLAERHFRFRLVFAARGKGHRIFGFGALAPDESLASDLRQQVIAPAQLHDAVFQGCVGFTRTGRRRQFFGTHYQSDQLRGPRVQ